VVTVSFVVWKQLRESDVLKYEFITTVTHKFRTPLTQIKWATEALAAARLSPDERAQIKYIETANTKLVELIDVLTVASESENVSHEYAMANVNISKMILETVAGSTARAREKNIDLSSHLKPGVVVPCDASKIHFVIQTLIDNALVYTPERGTIVVSLDQKGQDVIVSVRDSGIGMGADEVVRVFNKFYRSESAQGADTEGMGIALFVSREVIVRHGGKMWAESSGLGKGSTFSFTLKHSNSQDS
jgi:signal transduction histidine kinase